MAKKKVIINKKYSKNKYKFYIYLFIIAIIVAILIIGICCFKKQDPSTPKAGETSAGEPKVETVYKLDGKTIDKVIERDPSNKDKITKLITNYFRRKRRNHRIIF